MPIGSRAGWVRPFEKPWFVRVQLNFLGVDFPAEGEAPAYAPNCSGP